MKKILYPLLFLLFFIQNIQQSNADDIMGSDLTWTCIGQDSFLIKLVVYGDCNGSSFVSGLIKLNCATTGASITTINVSYGTPVDVTPICKTTCTRCQNPGCSFPYGIKRYIVQGIVYLNSAGTCCSITISWQQWGRNYAITTGASGTHFYTEAILNRCQNPCDNSPTFSNAPVAISCIGQPFTFIQGQQDIDVNSTGGLSDSFTYEWAEPLAVKYTPVAYISPYTYDKAINFYGFPNDALPWPRGIHLDPQSGDIQFQPMKSEITIMVVTVNEFRNGVKIAVLRREIQIIVIACLNNNPPSISTPNNVRKKDVCAGEQVVFDFTTGDPNPTDTVTISWNNAIPGASWTTTNGLAKYPTGKLTWTPTDADVSSLPYTYTVTAKDNACPVWASFTQMYQIIVMPKPQAIITANDSGCGNFCFKAIKITGSNPVYFWQSPSFKFIPNIGSVIQHKFQPGNYPYSVTMVNNGCITTYFDTVSIITDSFVSVKLPADITICSGGSISVTPIVYFNHGYIKYQWSTGDTSRILNYGPITKNEIITLTVADTNGCKAIDTIIITALKNPVIKSSNPVEICYSGNYIVKLKPAYQAFGVNNYISSFNWHKSGDTTTLSKMPELNTNDTGLFIFTIIDSFGCFSSDSFAIVNSIKNPQITMDDKDFICSNHIIPILIKPFYVVFGNDYISTYKWQRSGDTTTLSDKKDLNTRDTGIYKFTITDKFGCLASDSIKVELTKLIDTSLQVKDSLLTARPGMKGYKWYRNDTLVSAAGNIFIATVNGNYYVLLTDSNDCIDTSRTVIINYIGINQQHSMGSVKLYPNPTSGKLMLETDKLLTGDINLIITNIYGREIINQTLKSNDFGAAKEIDISDQPAGIYTIFIRYQKNCFYKLIIKE